MSKKCKKCGVQHEWEAHEQLDGSFVVSAGDTTISLVSASECGFSKSQARWVGYMLCERICLERQLAQVREENKRLRAAFNAAVRRPMGVVPDGYGDLLNAKETPDGEA